jgi:hypothetical protein
MLDDYDRLCKEYDAEVSAEYDKKYYLPFGSHLLPQEYQDFLCMWNKIMTEETGWWNGQFRKDFKAKYPTLWAEFKADNKVFMKLYPAEVAAVKAYQAEYVDEDSSNEDLPPLPRSPKAEAGVSPCTEGLCSNSCLVLGEDMPAAQTVDAVEMLPEVAPLVAKSMPSLCPYAKSMPPPLPALPSSPFISPVAAPLEVVAEISKPVTPRNPHYNHYNWPSPLPKVFVQHIRGRNAWNYNYWRFSREGAWPQDFKASWLIAGNTEFKLTHENCLRYLAYRCNCSVDEFLLKKPIDVNSKLFSPYSGVKGHFIRRYYY